VLLVHSFSDVEGISRLFSFNLSLMSETPDIDLAALIGKRVTITVVTPKDPPRYINGFVDRFAQAGADARLSYYQTEVVPWLWFLTRTANCRIFQNLSIPDIIQKVFNDRGLTYFSNKLEGSYPPPEYCVQYREPILTLSPA
jgi:type VI secretion system secreted protein VgrG